MKTETNRGNMTNAEVAAKVATDALANGTQKPKVVNITEIIDLFVGGDKAVAKEAYELMGTPSDDVLDLFDGLDKKNLPVNPAGLVGVASKKGGRTMLVSASRFCAYGPSIIVMKVTDATTAKIDSFSIFTDEGEGWKPVVFKTVRTNLDESLQSQYDRSL